MNKTKDDVASWIYDQDFSRLDQTVIAGFNLINFKQESNVLDVEFEFYVFEPTTSKEFGLFEIPHGTWSEFFPAGVGYEHEKNKYIFDTEKDCANLGDSGYRDIDSPYESNGKFYRWEDKDLSDTIIAELFDYNLMGGAGVQIIEHFELFNKNIAIPECIPKRLIPYLSKTMSDYPAV